MTDDEKILAIEAIYSRSKRRFPEVPELTVDELDRLRATTEVVLVDVRGPDEQQVSMIPGAVPVTEFEADSARFTGQSVVTYCTIGHRSGLYAKKLLASGWQAFNLKGAILAWTHADRELVDDQGSTRRVHVAGQKWSLEAAGYEPTW